MGYRCRHHLNFRQIDKVAAHFPDISPSPLRLWKALQSAQEGCTRSAMCTRLGAVMTAATNLLLGSADSGVHPRHLYSCPAISACACLHDLGQW
jgi:hypothetical protein